MPGGQWAVGSGQWAVGSRQSAVGSRQSAVGSRQSSAFRVVAILSNGGFAGIYEKLPARLRALHEVSTPA